MAWEDLSTLCSTGHYFRPGTRPGLSLRPANLASAKPAHIHKSIDTGATRPKCLRMITRIFLAFTALTFVAFGLWSITDPVGMTARLGVAAGGVSGTFEMRGIYGGVSLGAAMLCALGAFRPRFEFPALCFIAAYMGGYIIGRAASFAYGDTAMASNWQFAGFELVMFIAATWLVSRKA